MRKLKHHEQRLLRKTNFIEWQGDTTVPEQAICARYHISDLAIFYKYSNLVREIRRVAKGISKQQNVGKKTLFTRRLTQNLFNTGVLNKPSLLSASKIRIIDFCKRRLPSLMVQSRMVQNMKDAVRFIEQGHVCIGNDVVYDPDLLVNTGMEAYIKWKDNSKIKKTIDRIENQVDDYEE